MKLFIKPKNQKGFTLIELMVSRTIFTVLAVYGIGAVLTAMSQHALSQNMSNAMDNLNFVMEDMSRNIRLGTNIHCFAPGESGTGTDGSGNVSVSPQDCRIGVGSNKIVFQGITGSAITYFFDSSSGVVQVKKIVGNNPAQVITPAYIIIDPTKTGFIVYGSPQGDGLQPVVNITIAGKVTYKGIDSKFSIQTSVSSRPLDG